MTLSLSLFFQADEFFFFAGMMILDMMGLAFLATRYTYVDYTAGDPHAHLDGDNDHEHDEKRRSNRSSVSSENERK